MKSDGATNLIGIMGIAGGLATLIAIATEIIYSATPTIKVPGPYPYETPMQVPTPPLVSDSSHVPTPAPFLYYEPLPSLSAAYDRAPRTPNALHPLPAIAVRK